MQVSEIFYSIQGEGVNLGKPAIFLRLNGCNLRCSWCDSKYTWQKSEDKSISQILKEIKKHPTNHLVITGGEPLLQQKELKLLLPKLKNYYIEVETNGTITPKINKFVDNYNVSPKLNSPLNLKKFPIKKTWFKFVVNISKINKDLAKIKKYNISPEKIMLMPQTTTKSDHNQKLKKLIEHSKKLNYRITPRLHIMLYGNQRKK